MQRIVVDASRLSGDTGGWTVRVLLGSVEGPPVVQPFNIRERTVTRPWGNQRVPIPDTLDVPPTADPHHALCAGDEQAIGAILDKLSSRATEHDDVVVYGRWLFDTLVGPAWPAILEAVDAGRGPDVELALRWPARDADLHRLVWEAMHVGRVPLAGHPDRLVAVTRLVPVQLEKPPVTITGIPKVILAAGATWTDEVIRPGLMYMGLLRALDADGRCTTRVVANASLQVLSDECRRFRPDVVHLVAHGSADIGGNQAGIYLSDERGVDTAVSASQLISALSAGGRPMAVALSACHTGTTGPGDCTPAAADIVAGGIPFVSAMAGEVSELACRLYIRRMVDAVHAGKSFIEAAAHGRRAALMGAGDPSAQIDWAMAAAFVAESVDADFQIFDSTVVIRLMEWADKLKLRQEPVFVGRQVLLDLAEQLVDPDPNQGSGFAAITRDGDVHGLGGTRLLRELALRLLRDGHLPLLLGPYSQTGAPTDLRSLIAEVLERAVRGCEVLGIRPLSPLAFQVDTEIGSELVSLCTAAQLAAMPRPQAMATVRQAIFRFRKATSELDVGAAAGLLGADLEACAELARSAPAPFGEKSCVAVLGDDVHAWEDALDALLRMVTSSGLGIDRKVPVVVCGSLTARNGPRLKTFKEENDSGGGFRFPPLSELGVDEAVIGYQWVLLHPWRRASSDRYKVVYTTAPDKTPAEIREMLKDFDRSPSFVQHDLYTVAFALSKDSVRFFRRNDDEKAYADYVLHMGGGG